jgi:hypothetical protein
VAAGDYLLSVGQSARNSARDASSVDDFYHLQFLAMPYFQACGQTNTTLMDLTADLEIIKGLQTRFNEADEFIARVYTALGHDFKNSVDLEQILANQQIYIHLASERPRSAKKMLQKWVHDDQMFPEFWTPFVTAAAEDLPWEKT